jgi:hypothetical protein
MQRFTSNSALWAVGLWAAAWASACEDDDAGAGQGSEAASESDAGPDAAGGDAGRGAAQADSSVSDAGAAEAPAADGGEAPELSHLALFTLVSNADDTSSGYLRVVKTSEINGDELDLAQAREFPGNADLWISGKHAYVTDGDAPAITKHEISDSYELREVGSVSFENYGVADAAFWNNAVVSETKAYLTGTSASELIVWNPTSMEINGTIEIKGLENRGELMPRAALADRSNIVSNGKLFRPIYWTDEDYAGRTEDSVIVVIDTATDKVIDKIKVDCTGLDYGTVASDGNLYFSTWTGSVGTRLALDTPPTCFAAIDPKSHEVKSVTEFAQVTGGHEGAAMKHVGNGQFLFSVYDETRTDLEGKTPSEVSALPNFQVWLYDSKTHKADPVEAIDWNSGANYYTSVGGKVYALVPGKDWARTNAYTISDDKAALAFEVNGWSFRLFGL